MITSSAYIVSVTFIPIWVEFSTMKRTSAEFPSAQWYGLMFYPYRSKIMIDRVLFSMTTVLIVTTTAMSDGISSRSTALQRYIRWPVAMNRYNLNILMHRLLYPVTRIELPIIVIRCVDCTEIWSQGTTSLGGGVAAVIMTNYKSQIQNSQSSRSQNVRTIMIHYISTRRIGTYHSRWNDAWMMVSSNHGVIMRSTK